LANNKGGAALRSRHWLLSVMQKC